jgi:sulfur-oxidizing protein SoxZ
MAKKWKVRASLKGGVTTVKALITHPMETGMRKDKKSGKKIPAHYIQDLTAEHNGKKIMNADWGPAVSTNPYLSFKFTGAKAGDKLKLSWVDNKGNSDSTDVVIKS